LAVTRSTCGCAWERRPGLGDVVVVQCIRHATTSRTPLAERAAKAADATALRRRYGRAAKKHVSGVKRLSATVHQCPGCGDDVAVKRAKGHGEDEERLCARCQGAARRGARKIAKTRAAERAAAERARVPVHDRLGFFIGYVDQYPSERLAEIVAEGGKVGES